MLNIKELTEIANEFLNTNYNLKLEIPIHINNRLSRSLGVFYYSKDKSSRVIEINDINLNCWILFNNIIRTIHRLFSTSIYCNFNCDFIYNHSLQDFNI